MGITNLGITRRIRDSLGKAEARAIISFIVTLGFVTLAILFAVGLTTPEAYTLIMGYLSIVQFAVIGFYFGRPGNNNNVIPPTATPDSVTRTLEALVSTSQNQQTNIGTLFEVVKEINVSVQAIGKIMAPIIKELTKDKIPTEEEPKPEVQEDQTPPEEEPY